MPRLLPVVLLIGLSGCAAIYRAAAGESRLAPVKEAGAKALGCRGEVTVDERDSFHSMQFFVTGCGSTVACMEFDDWKCFSAPPKISDFGKERLPDGFLSVATSAANAAGCAVGEARVTTIQEVDHWGRGKFTANVCGHDYSCETNFKEFGEAPCEESDASKTRSASFSRESGLSSKRAAARSPGRRSAGGRAEHIFSFDACGKRYICSAAAGRSDCKLALAQPEVAPQPTAP
jgi:hypothetical protein